MNKVDTKHTDDYHNLSLMTILNKYDKIVFEFCRHENCQQIQESEEH